MSSSIRGGPAPTPESFDPIAARKQALERKKESLDAKYTKGYEQQESLTARITKITEDLQSHHKDGRNISTLDGERRAIQGRLDAKKGKLFTKDRESEELTRTQTNLEEFREILPETNDRLDELEKTIKEYKDLDGELKVQESKLHEASGFLNRLRKTWIGVLFRMGPALDKNEISNKMSGLETRIKGLGDVNLARKERKELKSKIAEMTEHITKHGDKESEIKASISQTSEKITAIRTKIDLLENDLTAKSDELKAAIEADNEKSSDLNNSRYALANERAAVFKELGDINREMVSINKELALLPLVSAHTTSGINEDPITNFRNQSAQFLSKLERAQEGQPEMQLLRDTYAIVLPDVPFKFVNLPRIIDACRTLLDNTAKGAESA